MQILKCLINFKINNNNLKKKKAIFLYFMNIFLNLTLYVDKILKFIII